MQLINYDDQSNPSTVPGLYTKLLEVDKVDLIVSGYATNMVAPLIPVAMQKNKTLLSLFALDANAEFKYSKYFSYIPTAGPHPKQTISEGSSRSPPHKIRNRRRSRSGPRMLNTRATPPRAAAPMLSSTASISSTTRPIRRALLTSRRSSAPSRRAIRISC